MASAPINPTALTPPRVELIDPRTGAISREWYRFFLSLLSATQTNQQETNTAPDTSALLASYDAMLAELATATLAAPSSETAELTQQVNALSMATLAAPSFETAELTQQINALSLATAIAPRAELGTVSSLQQASIPWFTFATSPSNVPPTVGTLFWDGGQTLNIQQTLNVVGKINEDNYYYIKATGAISKGQLVMFTGAVGSSGVLTGAPATGLGINDGVRLMGIAAENIALNGFGMVQWSGTLRGFDTTGSPYGETWADGDILYYNPSFAGGLTKIEPTAPNVRAVVAAVINAGSGGSGSVVIRLSVGSVLGGTDSNVYINSLTGGDILQYDGTDQRWENHAPSTITVGTATNLAGGAANRIAYQTGAGATGFIAAPTTANTFLEWSGSAFQWSVNPLGTVTSVSGTGTVNGITLTGTVTSSGSLTLGGTLSGVSLTTQVTGTLPVGNGGTGATTLTGYVKGNGTSAFTASSTIPASDVTGLATVATSGSFADLSNKPGIRSNGQNVISASTTLGAGDKGTNILVVTSGITITFPSSGYASGEGVAISNISGGNVTFSFPGGSDIGTTFPNNGTLLAFCDGGGFWRQYCYSSVKL